MFADVLDNDDSGEVDFKEFVQGMSKFSSKADKEEKLRFAFRIYDIDNDGFISNGELFQVGTMLLIIHLTSDSFQVLKIMVGSNLKGTQLQQIVDKTMRSVDCDQDGKISFEEFCQIVGKTDFDKKLQDVTV